MSENIIIEAATDYGRRLEFHVYICDFANILKSFIGSNFLSIPFGFGQCGLVLGVLGLVAIGTLSAHCCHLLVKCKYLAIQHIVGLQRHPKNFSLRRRGGTYRRKGFFHWNPFRFKLYTDHLIDPNELEQEKSDTAATDYSRDVQKQLIKTLPYGDLARMCLGQWGVTLTNTAILITQIGFCVNYAIFTANTLLAFFPTYTCTVQTQNNISIISPDCQYLDKSPWQPWLEEQWNNSNTTRNLSLGYTDILTVPEYVARTLEGSGGQGNGWSHGSATDSVHFDDRSAENQTAQTANQLTTSAIQNFTLRLRSSANSSLNVPASIPSNISSPASLPLPSTVSASMTSLASDDPDTLGSISPTTQRDVVTQSLSSVSGEGPVLSSAIGSSLPGESAWKEKWTDGPDLHLLFMFPMVIFVILVLPRNMRGLGVISTVGSLALVTGSLVILIMLISQFHLSSSWQWVRLEGLAIFFGTTASAFEGAGSILLVEASMDGNRHSFNPFLFGGISMLVVLHICISVLSYLTFGTDVAQLITMNVQLGSGLSATINVCLIVGILFTFPVMIFPVLRLVEVALLGKGCQCTKKSQMSEDTTQLLSATQKGSSTAPASTDVLHQVPAWKRNVVRIFLVLVIIVLAIFLRNSFAYVSAFIGALGSTVVAFILPCLFHLRLSWFHLPLSIKLKDMSIIIVGVVFCITGVYSVVRDMIAL